MRAVVDATGAEETAVRDFLDSRHRRHSADDTVMGLAAGYSLAAGPRRRFWRAWDAHG